MRVKRFFAAVAGLAMILGLTGINAIPASASDQEYNSVVSATPRNNTPHVLDGIVFSIAEVGNMIVLGGSFTQVQAANGGPVLTRNRLVAFNKDTGAISTSFAPNLNSTVRSVIAAPDGNSVYVGGQFGTLNGQSAPKVLRLNVGNGQRITQFNPGQINAVVHDMNLVGDRLFFGGEFTAVRGQERLGLAEVNATSGALSERTKVAFTDTHRGGNTFVHKFDVDAAGKKMVATGNFRYIDGQDRVQVGVLDISGAQTNVADWQTERWKPNCYPSFAYYLNDLDFAPDGSYFVLSSMGGYGSGPPTLCDTISRWQSDDSGAGINPVWVDYTGGDSVYALEATQNTIYFGGHMRWVNNPFRADAAGQGAVGREGIGALNASNGMPIEWNPGRDRGRGVFDLLATTDGVWVGSDTDRIARYVYKGRIALFPLAGGTEIPSAEPPALPVDVVQAGALSSNQDPRYLYRINSGGDTIPAVDGGMDWLGDNNAPGSNYRSSGNNSAGYDAVGSLSDKVPESTPRGIYSSERWDPAGGEKLQYNFPVDSGKNVEVRVYLADRCNCTTAPGSRVYNLDVEGSRAYSNIDLNADPGHNIGTMLSKRVVSDGSINITFDHVTENPAVNGVEIVDLDAQAPDPGASAQVNETYFDGTSAASKGATKLTGNVNWDAVRGGFVADGRMYFAMADGTFVSRTLNGNTLGNAATHDLYGLTNFSSEAQQMTGLFFKNDRIYFTLSGQNALFMRYLDLDSGIIGAERFTVATASAQVPWSAVRGMFQAGDTLYLATPDGDLMAANWRQGVTDGTAEGPTQVVSGPDKDGANWASRALISMTSDGAPPLPNKPPTADFGSECTDLGCAFDASGSTDSDGEIKDYAWNFGDGKTGTGKQVEHQYAEAGDYEVTLTVTDDDGATATKTVTVTVTAPENQAPTAQITQTCDQLACEFSGADSSDPDGEIASYAWSTSDGGSGEGATFSHEFAEAGTYTVSLTVTDDQGKSDTKQVELEVSTTPNSAPEAKILTTCNQLECTFNGGGSTDQEGEIASYKWSTSDGGSGDAVEFVHEFPAGGKYTVSLTVTDESGATNTVEEEVQVSAAANQVPKASFTQDCVFLSCTLDGTLSADPDGEITGYVWSVNGTEVAEGMVATHAFEQPGTYQVTLTVTDDANETGSVTQPVSVVQDPGPQPGNNVSFVASTANDGATTSTSHTVTVPSAVKEGDLMVAVLSTNSGSTTLSAPAGWQTRADASTTSMSGAIYSKIASASDAGSRVSVGSSGYVRGSLVLSAYRDATVDGASFAMRPETTSGAVHTTPVLNAQSNSWLLSYWADKTASTTTWQLPGGTVARETGSGSGAGHLSWMLADSNGAVSAGDAGGLKATANSTTANAVMASVVLAGAPGQGGNAKPVADFEWDCDFLACIFDGTGSSDPEGALLDYTWSVNGEVKANGESFSHAFSEAGTYQVSLKVIDPQGASGTKTASVSVEADTAPEPESEVEFVASAANSGTANAINHSVKLPSGIQAGDVLVGVFVTNQYTSAPSIPASWEQRAQVATASMQGAMFSKVATASDAGATVSVSVGGYARGSLSVAVYRNATVNSASFVMEPEVGAKAQHQTPEATAANGDWVLSYWADKTASTTKWSIPSALSTRQTGAGTGAGHLSWMLADSGGPISAGAVGGLTGTADSSTSNAVMGTVVLGAED